MTRHDSTEDTEADAAKAYEEEDAMRCGCRIEQREAIDPMSEFVFKRAPSITYCPKHANVDKVVEALENYQKFIETIGEPETFEVYCRAHQALATLEVQEPDSMPIGGDGTQ